MCDEGHIPRRGWKLVALNNATLAENQVTMVIFPVGDGNHDSGKRSPRPFRVTMVIFPVGDGNICNRMRSCFTILEVTMVIFPVGDGNRFDGPTPSIFSVTKVIFPVGDGNRVPGGHRIHET